MKSINNFLRKKIVRALLIFALIVIIYILLSNNITAQSIKNWVSSFGVLAPIAYLAAWAMLPVFFFPVPVLALAGGLSFGIGGGTILTLVGALINSSLMFFIARYFAKHSVTKFLKRRLSEKWWDRFNGIDDDNGFMLILILRLIPMMPYNVINYASGLTKLSFWRYSTATLFGIIPGTLIFLNVGDKTLNTSSPEFMLSVALVIILIVVSTVLARQYSKKI